MSHESDSETLRQRFQHEQELIAQHLELLHRKVAVHLHEADQVLRILVEYGILCETEARLVRVPTSPVPREDLERLVKLIEQVRPAIKDLLHRSEVERQLLGVPEGLVAIEGLAHHHTVSSSFHGEAIDFMLHALDSGVEESAIPALCDELRTQIIRDNKENAVGNPDYQPYDADHLVSSALACAKYLQIDRKIHFLETVLSLAADMNTVRIASAPGTTTNALRQAFLVLTTVFDAVIFDLMRLALRTCFFRLISSLGKKSSVSLGSWSDYSGFEDMRDSIIDEQLRSRYLKDVLFFLKDQGVACVTSPDHFGDLIEIVLRRNIQVHNRGIVDQGYLDPHTGGNVYGLKPGDIADIDEQYWEKANRICRACVDAIADWVDTLAR